VKEIFMKEQSEEYDSSEDPEYVPPSIIYETDKEYDEYSDGGDVIPKEEVAALLDEQKKHLEPPSTYIPIWVPVPSPAERIARAKEEVGMKKDESKSETSGKDTDSNGMKILENVKENEKEVEAQAPKITELKAGETGLTPTMKKLKVDGKHEVEGVTENLSKSIESNVVPKPKRERKKSKSKSGDGGDTVASVSVPPCEEAGKKKNVSENGDAAKSEVANDVGIAISPEAGASNSPDCSVKDKGKTVEKGKKSPTKKSPTKGGQEETEK